MAADIATQQLKPNIKAGATQSPVQTTESFRNLVEKITSTAAEKPTVRKPADLSGIFLKPNKLSTSNQNRNVSRG